MISSDALICGLILCNVMLCNDTLICIIFCYVISFHIVSLCRILSKIMFSSWNVLLVFLCVSLQNFISSLTSLKCLSALIKHCSLTFKIFVFNDIVLT